MDTISYFEVLKAILSVGDVLEVIGWICNNLLIGGSMPTILTHVMKLHV